MPVLKRDLPTRFNVAALRRLASDPRLGSELGILEVRGKLTLLEADVGRRIGQIYSRHDKALGARRTPKPPSLEIGLGRSPGLHEDDGERRRSERAGIDFDALQWLLRPYGAVAADVVTLCVDDRPVPPFRLPAVGRCLRGLAKPLLGRHA